MGKGGGSAGAVQLEPVKSAEDSMKEAATQTGRAQNLRRGLASVFSRNTMGAGASSSSATAGQAAKLGA